MYWRASFVKDSSCMGCATRQALRAERDQSGRVSRISHDRNIRGVVGDTGCPIARQLAIGRAEPRFAEWWLRPRGGPSPAVPRPVAGDRVADVVGSGGDVAGRDSRRPATSTQALSVLLDREV
jgi:hypothetical protein